MLDMKIIQIIGLSKIHGDLLGEKQDILDYSQVILVLSLSMLFRICDYNLIINYDLIDSSLIQNQLHHPKFIEIQNQIFI